MKDLTQVKSQDWEKIYQVYFTMHTPSMEKKMSNKNKIFKLLFYIFFLSFLIYLSRSPNFTLSPWFNVLYTLWVYAKWLQSCPTLWNPMDCSPQLPLSKGFSRQEYWSGLPCPPPVDLPDPGIEPASLMSPAIARRFFTTSITWEGLSTLYLYN